MSSVWVLTEVDGTTVAEASREALGEAAELARPSDRTVRKMSDTAATHWM